MKHIYGVDGEGLKWIELAGKLAASEALPHAADVDGTARFPREALKALGAQGFLGLTLPKDSGGAGQPRGGARRSGASAVTSVPPANEAGALAIEGGDLLRTRVQSLRTRRFSSNGIMRKSSLLGLRAPSLPLNAPARQEWPNVPKSLQLYWL